MELIATTYDQSLIRALEIAKSIAKENNNALFVPAHLLASILHNEVGLGIQLSLADIDMGYIKDWANMRKSEYQKSGTVTLKPTIHQKGNASIELADMIRVKLGDVQINGFNWCF